MRLNLGCGRDIKPGWVNMDRNAYPGVDVVWDAEVTPWPFGDGSFDRIYTSHFLEHVDFVPVWKEIGRVLLPGGILEARVPYGFRANPFHKTFWDGYALDLLTKDQYNMTDHGSAHFIELSRSFRRRPDGFPAWHLHHYLHVPVRGRVWEMRFELRKA